MELSIQYVAGLFDGEGSVHVVRNRPGWGASVSVGVCNKEVIDKLYTTFGGSTRMQLTKKGREFFVWRMGITKATEFLSSIQPFCIIKRSVIVVALKLASIMNERASKPDGRRALSNDEELLRLVLVHKIHCLNANVSFTSEL